MDPPPCELSILSWCSLPCYWSSCSIFSPHSYLILIYHFTLYLETSIPLPGFICHLSMCCCSVARYVWHSATPWIAACQASLSSIICWSFLKLISIESVMLSNHLILCHPLLLPSIFLQHQGLFQWVGSSHQVAKVLKLQRHHQSFQWVFRVDFL